MKQITILLQHNFTQFYTIIHNQRTNSKEKMYAAIPLLPVKSFKTLQQVVM